MYNYVIIQIELCKVIIIILLYYYLIVNIIIAVNVVI